MEIDPALSPNVSIGNDYCTKSSNIIWIPAKFCNMLLNPKESITLIDKAPIARPQSVLVMVGLCLKILRAKEPKPTKTVLKRNSNDWVTEGRCHCDQMFAAYISLVW